MKYACNDRCSGQALLTALVIILIVLVAAQSLMLLRLYQRSCHMRAFASAQQHGPLGMQGTGKFFEAPFPYEPAIETDEAQRNMESFQDRIERVFNEEMNQIRHRWKTGKMRQTFMHIPKTDLIEKGDQYVIKIDLPSAAKENITASLDGRVLSVTGSTSESVNKEEGDHELLLERSTGEFERVITLPGPVDPEKTTAVLKNGTLTITVGKGKEVSASRSIPVQQPAAVH